jgi:SOS-response transcriptional repressor LexA
MNKIILRRVFILNNLDALIGSRLVWVRKRLGFSTQKEFANKLGLPYQTYVNYEKGKRKLPDEVKNKLYEIGISLNYLMTGESPMILSQIKQENTIKQESELVIAIRKNEYNNENRFTEIETRLAALETILKTEKPALKPAEEEGALYTLDPAPEYVEEKEERIPYVWDIAAGPPIMQSDDLGETVSVPSRLLKKGERYYAASVRGGSMVEAGIRDGDMVLIRYADIPRDGAIQVVRYKDSSTLKRLRQTGKGWELHYEDGSGRVISGDSADYEVQGEFIAVLPKAAGPRGK